MSPVDLPDLPNVLVPEDLAPIEQRLEAAEGDLADLKPKVSTLEADVATLKTGTGSGYVGLPTRVITDPTDVTAARATIAAWLADRSSDNYMRSHLAFGFIGALNLGTTPFLAAGATPQLRGVRVRGMSKRGTRIRWGSSTTPVISAIGQLRNFEFADLTFESTVAEAKGVYFNSNVGADNQDGVFDRVEWQGAWEYGFHADGGETANLNSELVFKNQTGCGNGASFTNGLLVFGTPGGPAQQDQFLNIHLEDTKFEGSHGRYLVLNKGGSVTIDGYNSWLHTGQNAPNNEGYGEMIYIPTGSHFDSTMSLLLSRVRAELRFSGSKLLDCGWGPRGRVTMLNVSTDAHSFRVVTEEATLRGGARLTSINGQHGGWVGLRGPGGGTVIYDGQVSAPTSNSPGGALSMQMTGLTGNGIVRKEDTSVGVATFR